jgi:type VI secretion system Hcp family effector
LPFSVLLSAVLLTAIPTASAQYAKPRMFMKAIGSKQGQFNSSPSGESEAGKGFFELKDVSFNEETPAVADQFKNKGTVQHQTIKVSKNVDAASPQLLEASLTGEVFKSVVISFRHLSLIKENLVTFMTITISNATIASIKQNGNSETISLNYEKMKVEEPNP